MKSLNNLCVRCARRTWALEQRRTLTSSPARRRTQDVRIVEVGPRDGLQNEKQSIPVITKFELVRRLARTGLNTIEAGSFVHPKLVPQMASSDEILKSILRDDPASRRQITYQWLLPNMKGLENYLNAYGHGPEGRSNGERFDEGPSLNTSSYDANAMPSADSAEEAMAKSSGGTASAPKSDTSSESSLFDTVTKNTPDTPTASASYDQVFDAGPSLNTSSADANAMPSSTSGVDAMSSDQGSASANSRHEISLFMAATESFSQKNTNCSVAESLDRFRDIVSRAQAENYKVRAYISVALGCPYEGPDVDPHRVADICTELLEMGAGEISVADTTGMGTPPRTRKLLKTLQSAGVQNEDLALHFHDTYGQALVNTLVGLEHGVSVFDSAVGGLGGCPFSPGATGNVATEDLVNFSEGLGVRTGVDLEEVSRIGEWISKEVGRPNESRAGRATLAKLASA